MQTLAAEKLRLAKFDLAFRSAFWSEGSHQHLHGIQSLSSAGTKTGNVWTSAQRSA